MYGRMPHISVIVESRRFKLITICKTASFVNAFSVTTSVSQFIQTNRFLQHKIVQCMLCRLCIIDSNSLSLVRSNEAAVAIR